MPITLHTDETEELPEQTELAAGRERDDFQRAVDGHVEALKLATAKAHWPTEDAWKRDPAKLFHRYVVNGDDAAEMKANIRRAATLHKVEPLFYKNGKTPAGHAVIKFHVIRKTDKDGKLVKDDTLREDGTPKS